MNIKISIALSVLVATPLHHVATRWDSTSASTFASISIQTDASVYRIEPDTAYPGDYRLRLSVRLENRTSDTLWLAFPCYGGPRPSRYFV
ncbi:MAG: hypothetical protein ACREXY_21015, partial [Gammaproteobacteria bacterium]